MNLMSDGVHIPFFGLILPDRQRYELTMKDYYHYVGKSIPGGLLFEDTDAFVAACNRIGIVLHCLGSGLSLLSFCLMDNELHFLLRGREWKCDEFMTRFRTGTRRWLRDHPGHGTPQKVWSTAHWQIDTASSLRETVAYIHRLPMKRGLNVRASSYAWSSAGLMFADPSFITGLCRRVMSLGVRESRRMLSSHTVLPGRWLVMDGAGMLWPGSFVDVPRVERLFSGKVEKYEALLCSDVETSVGARMGKDCFSLSDADIRILARDIVHRKFGSEKIHELDLRQKRSLARILKRCTGAEDRRIRRIARLGSGD